MVPTDRYPRCRSAGHGALHLGVSPEPRTGTDAITRAAGQVASR